MRSFLPAIALGLALGCSQARAQDAGCPDDSTPTDVYETFPGGGAQGVAINAPFRARFAPGELNGVEINNVIRVVVASGPLTSQDVAGTITRIGDTLAFVPTGGWMSRTQYAVTVSGPIASVSRRFTTSATTDLSAPAFDDSNLSISTSDASAVCSRVEDGLRVDVQFTPATDLDGSPGDIEYLLYQTRGPGLDAPTLRGRLRNFAGTKLTMAFVAPANELQGTFCMQVLAVDGNGHIAPTDEDCFDPRLGDAFQGLCAVRSQSARADYASALTLLGFAWLSRRARRLRSR